MDYREELLGKMLNCLSLSGVTVTAQIRDAMVECIGQYEITERCTELAVLDDSNVKMIQMFLVTKKTEGGSAETAANRYGLYRRFSDDVGKPFSEINAFDIRLWLAGEQKRVCLSTAESYRTSLRSLFTWLHTEGMIPVNPMVNIKPIKHPEAIKSSFTATEVDALKGACRNVKERAMVELLLSSGLRCEEFCNLKWQDLNFETREVTVLEGKGGKNRITMMDDVARKYLLEYKKTVKGVCEYAFASRYRGQYKKKDEASVWKLLKVIGKRAGVEDVHPHKFRHTFATALYKRGMDIRMIQRLLGHSNIQTTLIYIDSDTESLKDAYKRCV